MVMFSLSSLRRDSSCGCGSIHAGISSVSSSKKYSGIGGSRLVVLLRAAESQVAHALDHAHALGDGDRAARVEGVEDVRALERPVIRGQDQLLVETAASFLLVDLEELPVLLDVGHFEVELRELVLLLFAHGAVSDAGRPLDVVDRLLASQEH